MPRPSSRAGNRGATDLPLRRRQGDPMREFDRLPRPLRRWLSEAALPWSPRSAARAWRRALSDSGGDPTLALQRLDQAQARTLARSRAVAPSASNATL